MEYGITYEQLQDLEHYKRMFEHNAETIKELCNSEKDDIIYGFELGQLYKSQRDYYIAMYDLCDQIRNQKITNSNDEE